MPFLAAGLLTGIATPFARGAPASWVTTFYGGILHKMLVSPRAWLTMLVIGFLSALLTSARRALRMKALRGQREPPES